MRTKRALAFLLTLAMLLGILAGCGGETPPVSESSLPTTSPTVTLEPVESSPVQTPPIEESPVEETSKYDYFTQKELDHAVSLGLLDAEADLDGDITTTDFFALLEKAVSLTAGDVSQFTAELPESYVETDNLLRVDAVAAFYLAAQAMGIDVRYVNEAGVTGIGDPWSKFPEIPQCRLFPYFSEDMTAVFYNDNYVENQNSGFYCATFFVTHHGSVVSNRAIMSADSSNNFNFDKFLSKEDAILGSYRLITSIEAEPEHVTLEDAVKLTYDPSIITEELLAAGNDLPEITASDIPAYTAMCYLEKESAYQRVGSGWFSEDTVRAAAAAGIDFLSVRYDFSYWNYPDFDSGMVNVDELRQLDQLIAWGIQYGVHINIEGNGCINQGGYPRGLHWYNMDSQLQPLDNLCNGDPQLQQEFLACWEVMASRYADIPAKYLSFNLICEPSSQSEDVFVSTFLPVAQAINSYNTERVVFCYGNVWTACPGLAAYGYPLAWSIFYPDVLTQVEQPEGSRPVYEKGWNDWYLNGCLGPDAGIVNSIPVRLEAEVVSATLYVDASSQYEFGPSYGEGPSYYTISLNGTVVHEGSVTPEDGWKRVDIDIPTGTTFFELTNIPGGGFITCDGIIFTRADGTEIKVIPTRYEYPAGHAPNDPVPHAMVTVKVDGTVTSDVPLTFELVLSQNELGYYLDIAKQYNVGLIVSEWGPVKSTRNDAYALDYFRFMAEGFREYDIPAALSRTPGFSYSGLTHARYASPNDYTIDTERFVPVGDGSEYWIDTWEMEALTGKEMTYSYESPDMTALPTDPTEAELLLATEYGLPMEKLGQETVNCAELAELMDAFLAYAAPEKLDAWKTTYAALRTDAEPLSRADAMTYVFLAAYTAGNGYDKVLFGPYTVAETVWGDPWENGQIRWDLFAPFNEPIYKLDQYEPGYVDGAGFNYNLGRLSPVSGEYPFSIDKEENSLRGADLCTYEEALLAVTRIIASSGSERFLSENGVLYWDN